MTIKPFFLDSDSGRLFSLCYLPGGQPSPEHFVLFYPPFAEELNKARKMIAMQARNLAQLGYGVLIVDYHGTGDSEGDFGDATWEKWLQDIGHAAAWLDAQGAKQVTLWGLRFGALAAVRTAPLFGQKLVRAVLWQPVIRGDQMVTQFLRLRLAADMMKPGEKLTTKILRARLAAEGKLEIAGYLLSNELIRALDALDLRSMDVSMVPVIDWYEVVASQDSPPALPATKLQQQWREAAINVNSHVVTGDAFWNTTEITLAQDLLEKTTTSMKAAVGEE